MSVIIRDKLWLNKLMEIQKSDSNFIARIVGFDAKNYEVKERIFSTFEQCVMWAERLFGKEFIEVIDGP